MVKQLLVIGSLLHCLLGFCQQDILFCKQISALQTLVDTSHYSPKPVDDALSMSVFELFVDELDENKRFFTESDMASFKVDYDQIDDYISNNSCHFIDKYTETLHARISMSKSIIASLEEEPLDYSGSDTLYFKPEHGYFKTESDIKRFWNKRIRYLVISKLIEDDSIIDEVKANFKVLEQSLKPKIIKNQLCILDELLQKNGGLNTYVKETFLNALIHYQDPNSTYFNDSEKTIFENGVSNNKLSFGFMTSKNEDGEIVIAYIVPGGAAYKDGNFEENDVITSLSSGSSFLETYCVSNSDIQAFTNDKVHNTIVFRLKKANGAIQEVELTKSIAKVEDNSVRGYVLQNKSDFGYIRIPSFYTDLESPNGLGLANDVAKELFKLQKEGVKGLVLDLRFNGGGSMKEAAELSGMFIDRGPLSIIKYNNGETYTIKDMNRGTLFNKPIVVLINNYSASASEFFASVMQDYNRAVIIGSPSHGKSSAQVILPLSNAEDLGFCKLTVEKFYRITGLSHQSQGVIPDIVLPSLYDNFKSGEQFEKYALSNDSVVTKLAFKPFKSLPLRDINSKSASRVTGNTAFKAIKDINVIIWRDYANKDSEYPLTLDNIYNDVNGYNRLWDDFYDQLKSQTSSITVKNSQSTAEIIQYNRDDVSSNEKAREDIQNDIYIEEAYTVLYDLLTPNTNN